MPMNLPNKLTILRIFLIPLFVVFLYLPAEGSWPRVAALVIFLAACLTDAADGYIARRDGLVTNFGKFMDPLADKLLVVTALLCLLDQEKIPVWAVILIVAREFIISGFRLVAADRGVVIAAGWWGKAKTVAQMGMILLMILDLPVLRPVTTALLWLSVALTLISLADYLYANRHVLREEES